MRRHNIKTLFPLVALLVILISSLPSFSQGLSVTDSGNNLNPVFATNFSGMPDLPNPSYSQTDPIRLRLCGNQATNMNIMNGVVTTWELRASVAGLDNPVMLTSPDIQYSDISLSNIMVTVVGAGLGLGTVTLQAPFSSGTATLADILNAMNNALVVSGFGTLRGNSMAECNNAMDGTDTRYFDYSATLNFTHDFYFDVMSYLPSVIYTLICTSNCF